jgi:hypothetical protein
MGWRLRMGCDIHCYAEKLINGEWKQITGFKSNYYDKNSSYFNDERYLNSPHPYDGRNYSLFAFLADVRNEFGFARIEPISPPRGLPEDLSKEILNEASGWKSDGHSYSWLLLNELISHDYNIVTTHQGWVTPKGFEEYMKYGAPSGWCTTVSRGSVECISNNEMQKYVEIGDKELYKNRDLYTKIEFKLSLYEQISSFINNTIPNLKKRSEDKDYNDIRIVFWFDN